MEDRSNLGIVRGIAPKGPLPKTPVELLGLKEELTLALCQVGSELGQKEKNLEKAIFHVEQAAGEGADLVAFPETYLVNYMAQPESRYLAEPVPGPSTLALAEAARAYNIYIVLGMPTCVKEFPGLVRNSAAVIGPREGVMGVYSKLSLPTCCMGEILFTEGNYWTPGTSLPIFDIRGWKVAINICYDCWIPETPRVQTLMGAQLLLTISAGPDSTAEGWEHVLKTRAIENRVYQAYCNVVGSFREVSFFGGNRVIGPGGKEVVNGPLGEEALVIGTIHAHSLYDARCQMPGLRPGLDVPSYLYHRLSQVVESQ
ncbi:MAG: carbon-nitrogen hydrolase family protein [Candidatus Binatia bacterium]|jgi:predicted amidohydrolase|nr:carbon-nitrogen hydrolase family protein [Candidatus Binatia bacterium]